MFVRWMVWLAVGCGLVSGDVWAQAKRPQFQYRHGQVLIPAASEQEPVRESFSLEAAVNYLQQGAKAWTGWRRCVACHTNGSYLALWPELSPSLGPADPEIHRFFVSQLVQLEKQPREKLQRSFRPTQLAYLALGLAQWDKHIRGELSAETDRALRLMFSVQASDGSIGNARCWPPLESSNFHGATVAARAVAAAPGWLQSLDPKKDQALLQQVDRLRQFLTTTEPPHDYARVLLLWASTYWPELLSPQRKEELVKMIWSHQREDGGWSLRSFATAEQWAGGYRAARLKREPDYQNPPSDGHMTGLAVLVLRRAGVPADEPRIQKALRWLRTHQRQSGRWWTRSLNTDKYHFITYTGTLYPVAALVACNNQP